MPRSGMKIEADRAGAIQKVTFNLKTLSKSKPELARLIEDIAEGERALKDMTGEAISIQEWKAHLEKKHHIKL